MGTYKTELTQEDKDREYEEFTGKKPDAWKVKVNPASIPTPANTNVLKDPYEYLAHAELSEVEASKTDLVGLYNRGFKNAHGIKQEDNIYNLQDGNLKQAYMDGLSRVTNDQVNQDYMAKIGPDMQAKLEAQKVYDQTIDDYTKLKGVSRGKAELLYHLSPNAMNMAVNHLREGKDLGVLKRIGAGLYGAVDMATSPVRVAVGTISELSGGRGYIARAQRTNMQSDGWGGEKDQGVWEGLKASAQAVAEHPWDVGSEILIESALDPFGAVGLMTLPFSGGMSGVAVTGTALRVSQALATAARTKNGYKAIMLASKLIKAGDEIKAVEVMANSKAFVKAGVAVEDAVKFADIIRKKQNLALFKAIDKTHDIAKAIPGIGQAITAYDKLHTAKGLAPATGRLAVETAKDGFWGGVQGVTQNYLYNIDKDKATTFFIEAGEEAVAGLALKIGPGGMGAVAGAIATLKPTLSKKQKTIVDNEVSSKKEARAKKTPEENLANDFTTQQSDYVDEQGNETDARGVPFANQKESWQTLDDISGAVQHLRETAAEEKKKGNTPKHDLLMQKASELEATGVDYSRRLVYIDTFKKMFNNEDMTIDTHFSSLGGKTPINPTEKANLARANKSIVLKKLTSFDGTTSTSERRFVDIKMAETLATDNFTNALEYPSNYSPKNPLDFVDANSIMNGGLSALDINNVIIKQKIVQSSFTRGVGANRSEFKQMFSELGHNEYVTPYGALTDLETAIAALDNLSSSIPSTMPARIAYANSIIGIVKAKHIDLANRMDAIETKLRSGVSSEDSQILTSEYQAIMSEKYQVLANASKLLGRNPTAYESSLGGLNLTNDQLFSASEKSKIVVDDAIYKAYSEENDLIAQVDMAQEQNPIGHESNNTELVRSKIEESLEYGIEESGADDTFLNAVEDEFGNLVLYMETEAGVVVSKRNADGSIVTPGEKIMQDAFDQNPNMDKEEATRVGESAKEADRATAVTLADKPKQFDDFITSMLGSNSELSDVHYDLVYDLYEKAQKGSVSAIQLLYGALNEIAVGKMSSVENIADVENQRIDRVRDLASQYARTADPIIRESIAQDLLNDGVTVYPYEVEDPLKLIKRVNSLKKLDRNNFNFKALGGGGRYGNSSFMATVNKAFREGTITLASLYSQMKDEAARHLFPVYTNTQHYSRQQAYSAINELKDSRTLIDIKGLSGLAYINFINTASKGKRAILRTPSTASNGSLNGGFYEIEVPIDHLVDMFTTPGWSLNTFWISTIGTVHAPASHGFSIKDLINIGTTLRKKVSAVKGKDNTYLIDYNGKRLEFVAHVAPIAGQMVTMYTAQVTPDYSITLPGPQSGTWKNKAVLPDISGVKVDQETTSGDESLKQKTVSPSKEAKDNKTVVGTKSPGVNPSFGTIGAIVTGTAVAGAGMLMGDDEARDIGLTAMMLPLGKKGREIKSIINKEHTIPLPTSAEPIRTKTALNRDSQSIARIERLFPDIRIEPSSSYEITKQFRESLYSKEFSQVAKLYKASEVGLVNELSQLGENSTDYSISIIAGSVDEITGLFENDALQQNQEIMGFFSDGSSAFAITKWFEDMVPGVIKQTQKDLYTVKTRPTPITRALADGIPQYLHNYLSYDVFAKNYRAEAIKSKVNPYGLEYTDESSTGIRGGYGERNKTTYNVSLPTSGLIAKHYLGADLANPRSLDDLELLNEKMANAYNLHLANEGLAKIVKHVKSEQKRRAVGAMQGQQLINLNSPIFSIHLDESLSMMIPSKLVSIAGSSPAVQTKWLSDSFEAIPSMDLSSDGVLINNAPVYSSISKSPYPSQDTKPYYKNAFGYLDNLDLAGGVLSDFKKRAIVNYALYNTGTRNVYGPSYTSMINELSLEKRFDKAIEYIESSLNPNNDDQLSGEARNEGIARLFEKAFNMFKGSSIAMPYGDLEKPPVPTVLEVKQDDPSYRMITERIANKYGGKDAVLSFDKKSTSPVAIVQNLVDMGDYVHDLGATIHDGSDLTPINQVSYIKQRLASLGFHGIDQVIDARIIPRESVIEKANKASSENIGPVFVVSQGEGSFVELPNYFGGTPFYFGHQKRTDWPGAQVIGSPKLDNVVSDLVATKLAFLDGRASVKNLVESVSNASPNLNREDINSTLFSALSKKYYSKLSVDGLNLDAEIKDIANVIEPTMLPMLKHSILFSKKLLDVEHPGYHTTRKLLGSISTLFEDGLVPFNEDGTINSFGFVASILNAFSSEKKSNRLLDGEKAFSEDSSSLEEIEDNDTSTINEVLKFLPDINELTNVENFLNEAFADLNDMYLTHLNRSKNLAAKNTNESFKSKQLADMYQEESLKLLQAKELLVPIVSVISKTDAYLSESKYLGEFSDLETNISLSPSNIKAYTNHADYVLDTIIKLNGGTSSDVREYLSGIGYSSSVLNQFAESDLKLASIMLHEIGALKGLSTIDESVQTSMIKQYASYGVETFANAENIKALYSTLGIQTPTKSFDQFHKEDDLRVDARQQEIDEFGNPVYDGASESREERVARAQKKATYQFNPFKFKYFDLDPDGESFSILKNNLNEFDDRAILESSDESYTKKGLLESLYSDPSYREKLASKFKESGLFGDVGDQELIRSSSFVIAGDFVQAYTDDGITFDIAEMSREVDKVTSDFPRARDAYIKLYRNISSKSKDGVIPRDRKTATILLQSGLKECNYLFSKRSNTFNENVAKLKGLQDSKLGQLIIKDFTNKVEAYHAKSMYQTIKTIENFPKLYSELLLNHEGDVGSSLVANPKVFAGAMSSYRKWVKDGEVDILKGNYPKTIKEAMSLVESTTSDIAMLEDAIKEKPAKSTIDQLNLKKAIRGQLMSVLFDLAIGDSIALSARKKTIPIFDQAKAQATHIKTMVDMVASSSNPSTIASLVHDLHEFNRDVGLAVMPHIESKLREFNSNKSEDQEWIDKLNELGESIANYKSVNNNIKANQVEFIANAIDGIANIISTNMPDLSSFLKDDVSQEAKDSHREMVVRISSTIREASSLQDIEPIYKEIEGYSNNDFLKYSSIFLININNSALSTKKDIKPLINAMTKRRADIKGNANKVKNNIPLVVLAGLSGSVLLSSLVPGGDDNDKEKPILYDAGIFALVGLGGKYAKGANGKVYSQISKAKPFSPLARIESAEQKRYAERAGALSTEKINYLDKLERTVGPVGAYYDIAGRFNRRFFNSASKMSKVQKFIMGNVNPRINALNQADKAKYNDAYNEMTVAFSRLPATNTIAESIKTMEGMLDYFKASYPPSVVDVAFDQAKVVHAIRHEALKLGVNDTQFDPSFTTKEVNKELLFDILNDSEKSVEFVNDIKKANSLSNNVDDIGRAMNSILHRVTRATDITEAQLNNIVNAVASITKGNATTIYNAIRKPNSDIFTETNYVGWKPFSAILPKKYSIDSQNAVIGKLDRAIKSIEAVKQFGIGFEELRSFLNGIKPSMKESEYADVVEMIGKELSISFDNNHQYNTELNVRSIGDSFAEGALGLSSAVMVRTNAFTSPFNNLAGLIGIVSGYGPKEGIKAFINSLSFLSGQVKDPNDLLNVAQTSNQLSLDYIGALTSSSTNHKLLDSINSLLQHGLVARDKLTTEKELYNSLRFGMSPNQKMSFKKSLPGFIATAGLPVASLFTSAVNNSLVYAGGKLGQSVLPKAIKNIANHGTGWQSDLNELQNFLEPSEIVSLIDEGKAITDDMMYKASAYFANTVNGLTTGKLDKWEPKGVYKVLTQFMAIASNSFNFAFKNFLMPMAHKYKETGGNWAETARASSRTAKMLFGGVMGTIALGAYKSAFGLNDYEEEELTNSSLAYRLYLSMATSQANVIATPIQYLQSMISMRGLSVPTIGLGASAIRFGKSLLEGDPLKAAQTILPYLRGASEFSMQDESTAKLFLLNMMAGQSYDNFKRLSSINHSFGSLPDYYDAMTSDFEKSKLGEPSMLSANPNESWISKAKKKNYDELKKSVEKMNK